MMVFSYPPGHVPGPGDPAEINADQREVLLGPSRFTVTGRRAEGDATVITVDAHPLTLDEALTAIKETGSDLGSDRAYELFSAYFAATRCCAPSTSPSRAPASPRTSPVTA